MMTDKQLKQFIKPFKEFRHLVIKHDKDAGTLEGFDNDEVFIRAIAKDNNTWIVTTYDTKFVKWKETK